MRLLVFSDIHNKLGPVQLLREVETNNYDALVVAGDIGLEILDDFYAIADSFECPVYFVYGNWDSGAAYERNPSRHCILLNQQIEGVAGYFFTGFSGCELDWGCNPDYLQAVSDVEKKFIDLRLKLYETEERCAPLLKEQEEELNKRGKLLLERKARVGEKAHRKAREKLRDWNARRLAQINASANQIRHSPGYRTYRDALWACKKEALGANTQKLIEVIANSKVPANRLVVLTHDRIFRLADHGCTPLLHIFGHRHQFKVSSYRGTTYLNASALDPSLELVERRYVRPQGGYCRLTIEGDHVSVQRCLLPKPTT